MMLIFSADLKKVEEICGRGFNGNEIFVWFRRGVGQVDYFEIFGSLSVTLAGNNRMRGVTPPYLDILRDLDAAHLD